MGRSYNNMFWPIPHITFDTIEAKKSDAWMAAAEGDRVMTESAGKQWSRRRYCNDCALRGFSSLHWLKGKVTQIMPYGLFVDIKREGDLYPFVGLVHYSATRKPWTYDLSQVASVGDEIDVRILSVDRKSHKLFL